MAIAETPHSALTISTSAGSKSGTQSHRTLPFAVCTSSARWPMAKCGSTPMPVSLGSSNRIELRCVSRILSSVVHCWPVTLRYCRSSWHTAQTGGGCSPSACCVPQVVQMKFGIQASPFRLPLLLDHRLQRLPVLQAGQYLLADHEHRDAADARLLVGVTQRPLVRFPVLPGPQRLLELLLVQPDLAGQ